jgi:hypothetical protein
MRKKSIILIVMILSLVLVDSLFSGQSTFPGISNNASDAKLKSGIKSPEPSPASAYVRKGPYLIYPGIIGQMKILWQLYSAYPCTLEWGSDTTYSSGSIQTTEYNSSHQHTYTITDLAPNRHYFFKVIINSDFLTGSFFSAPDSTVDNLNFIAYGDTRSYPGTQNQVAARINSTYHSDSSFQTVLISVGDLVNTGTNESDWDTQFFDTTYTNIHSMLANLPYQSTMGNHEGTGTLFVKYFPYPFVAGRYWSFDYGPAHFTIIDQYTAYGPGSPQLQWITNDLAQTTKPWKFIVLHEPGWTAGGDHPNNTSVQNYIQPLCLQYGVSIVFGGHNHYYARAVVNGVEHLTIGGGGAPLYQPNPSYPNIVTCSMTYHFTKIEISGGHLQFTAISSSGVVLDTFSLSHGPNCIYVPGDINDNGILNGIDVTYAVGYFKGGSAPTYSCECTTGNSWFVAGDVNGDCIFNGIDVSYMVSYFKGGAIPIPCPNCPPEP